MYNLKNSPEHDIPSICLNILRLIHLMRKKTSHSYNLFLRFGYLARSRKFRLIILHSPLFGERSHVSRACIYLISVWIYMHIPTSHYIFLTSYYIMTRNQELSDHYWTVLNSKLGQRQRYPSAPLCLKMAVYKYNVFGFERTNPLNAG